MRESSDLQVTPRVRIPFSELSFRATRSGGPGGQHVNTSSTRVELWWSLATSPSLSEDERARVRARLGARVTEDGWLRVVAAATRSQAQNRLAAVERFTEVLRAALHVPKTRRPTRPSRAVKERRLQSKRHQSDRKRERRRRPDDD